jgi:hypothetical protein
MFYGNLDFLWPFGKYYSHLVNFIVIW